MISLRDAFEARLSRVENSIGRNEEQDCVLRGFTTTGEWVELLLGNKAAVAVMRGIARALSPDSVPAHDAADWRECWIRAADFAIWPDFFEDLRNLRGFAEAGIWRPWRLADCSECTTSADVRRSEHRFSVATQVKITAELIRQFVESAPPSATNSTVYESLLRTRAKALARLKFDSGLLLTPQELADLSNLSLKRVQNAAYDKSDRALKVDKDGRIKREAAVDWLAKKGFLFSIWQQITDLEPLTAGWGHHEAVDLALLVNDEMEVESEAPEADYLFVPVASDGSRFLPGVCREQGYQIGPKSSPTMERDYFRALDALIRQPTPRWRRPSEAGNWGVVSGVAWERVLRSDLEHASGAID